MKDFPTEKLYRNHLGRIFSTERNSHAFVQQKNFEEINQNKTREGVLKNIKNNDLNTNSEALTFIKNQKKNSD